jgi:hypothetical protein
VVLTGLMASGARKSRSPAPRMTGWIMRRYSSIRFPVAIVVSPQPADAGESENTAFEPEAGGNEGSPMWCAVGRKLWCAGGYQPVCTTLAATMMPSFTVSVPV